MKNAPFFPTPTTAAFPEQMPQVDPPTGLMGGAPIGGGAGPSAGAAFAPPPPSMPTPPADARMPSPSPTPTPAPTAMGGSGTPPNINQLLSAPIDWSKYNPRERNEFSDPTSPMYLPTMDPRLKELDAALLSTMSPENAARIRESGQSAYALAYNAGGSGYTWIPGVGEAPVEIAPGLTMPNGPDPYNPNAPSQNAFMIPQALVRRGGLTVPGVSTEFERLNNVNSWATPVQQGIRNGPVPGMDGRPLASGPGATPTPGMPQRPQMPGMPGMGGGPGMMPPGFGGMPPGMPGMPLGLPGGMPPPPQQPSGPSWNVGRTPFGYTQWNRNNNFAPSFSSPQNFANMLGLMSMMGGLGGMGMGFPMSLGGGGNAFSGLPMGMPGMGMPGMGFNTFGGLPGMGGIGFPMGFSMPPQFGPGPRLTGNERAGAVGGGTWGGQYPTLSSLGY